MDAEKVLDVIIGLLRDRKAGRPSKKNFHGIIQNCISKGFAKRNPLALTPTPGEFILNIDHHSWTYQYNTSRAIPGGVDSFGRRPGCHRSGWRCLETLNGIERIGGCSIRVLHQERKFSGRR